MADDTSNRGSVSMRRDANATGADARTGDPGDATTTDAGARDTAATRADRGDTVDPAGTGATRTGRLTRRGERTATAGRVGRAETAAAAPATHHEALGRQRAAYGGIKWGSGFFGWLTAMGMALLLTAVLVAIGAAVAVSTGTSVSKTSNQLQNGTGNSATIGIASGIALLVVMFVAYYCGGYVAGRMARLSGTRQGLAVWLWGLFIAIVVGIVAAVAGSKYDILGKLNGFPRIPTSTSNLTTGGIVALVLVAIVTLLGALFGGSVSMRYHRRIDRAGFEPYDEAAV